MIDADPGWLDMTNTMWLARSVLLFVFIVAVLTWVYDHRN